MTWITTQKLFKLRDFHFLQNTTLLLFVLHFVRFACGIIRNLPTSNLPHQIIENFVNVFPGFGRSFYIRNLKVSKYAVLHEYLNTSSEVPTQKQATTQLDYSSLLYKEKRKDDVYQFFNFTK